MTRQTRVDPHLGTVVHIVADRQGRPNLPVDGCPFCVGGLEAPEPYEVRAFKNRWPALEGGNSEVILDSPDHQATLATLPVEHLGRIVDLWCERTTELRDLPGGEHVVVFENRASRRSLRRTGRPGSARVPTMHGASGRDDR
ncbi:MAG: hypothetical protein ACKOQ1_08365, partial [Actinomycetota bacterium]